jgi:Flp pilus assembly protein TadD
VLQLQPENGKAFYALGIAFDRTGQPERAAEMYRRSREVTGR